MPKEIKHIAPDANSFVANGTKYIVHGTLSVERFQQYEKLQSQFAWGVDFESLFSNLQKVYAKLNEVKFVEASVLVSNMLEGVARGVDKRVHPAFLLCTLFICREGEDLATWNESEQLEKIEDWKQEYSAESFFALASYFVRGYTEAYEQYIQPISMQDEVGGETEKMKK